MGKKRQRAAAAAPAPPPPSRWILDGPRDLSLMVAAPLWILPFTFLVAAAVTDRVYNGAIMALGSIGHHLPGLLRAYGDRALFRRYRARFILAPLGLGALCVGFSAGGLHALMFVAFAWGVWHGMMQTYGFDRIYAAKSGAGDRRTARLDFALIATWFFAAVLLSPQRLAYLVDMAATCGMPYPTAAMLSAVKIAAIAAPAIATAAWLVGMILSWRAGHSPSLVRLGLLASSLGFWWFANVRVAHPMLGMPLFELFHDVQYLAIVWAFNRRRADTAGRELSPFLRAIFRPNAVSLVVYVALVAAYGALGLVPLSGTLGDAWGGLLAASQLLHFYYDGFIWKVRDKETGATLGVANQSAPSPTEKSPLAGRLLWGLLAATALILGIGEVRNPRSIRERTPVLAELVPDNSVYQFLVGEMHWEKGDHDEALARFRRSLALDPSYDSAKNNLALSLGELADQAAAAGDGEKVKDYIGELSRLRPTLTGEHAQFADGRIAKYAQP
jgi:hypothetical protein